MTNRALRSTTCGYHGDDTSGGRCQTCDSLEVVPRSQWKRLERIGYASRRSSDGHPMVLRLVEGVGTCLVPVLIGA